MDLANFQYEAQLKELISMGYDKDTSMAALQHFKGNMNLIFDNLDKVELQQNSKCTDATDSHSQYLYSTNPEERLRDPRTPTGLANVGNSIYHQ